MFNNLVNAADGAAFLRRAAKTPSWLVSRFSIGADARAREAWAHTAGDPIHWFDIPAVLERQNRLVSGDPNVSYIEYLRSRYLEGRADLDAVSLGCGTGEKEIEWARTGLFRTLRGFDFSPARVAVATEAASAERLAGVLRFEEADVYALTIEPESLDMVIFDDALHHFTPVRTILERAGRWLRGEGLLIVREYVGPRAFQWQDRQVEAANGLLALIPPELRTDYTTGRVRTHVERPSRLRMRLTDPSEAVESDAILPAVRELFDVVEEFALGGTIVHLATGGIAHHFVDASPDATRHLNLMFDSEDALLASGDIPSDHMLIIARRR